MLRGATPTATSNKCLESPLTRHLATENAAACSNGRNAEAALRLVATCECPVRADNASEAFLTAVKIGN